MVTSTSSARRVPVFMYHHVEPAPLTKNPYLIGVCSFRDQMNVMKACHYSSGSLQELLGTQQQAPKPASTAVITFDDGYADNFRYAVPELVRLGLRATFFIITSRIGDADFMSWSELRELQRLGMSVQSHTVNHLPLETLSSLALTRELRNSKATLEDGLGTSVDIISYPHGSFDERVTKAAQDSGYAGACCSHFGYLARGASANQYRLPRIAVRSGYGMAEFSSLLHAEGFLVARMRALAATRQFISDSIGVQRYQSLYNAYYRLNREAQ